MRRVAVIAAVAAVLGAAPGLAHDAEPGQLVVKERRADTGAVYVEGFYSYLAIRRARTGQLVLRRRYEDGPVRLNRRLHPGRYRLISYVRACSGNCEQGQDPPRDRCARTFRLPSGSVRRATLHTGVGRPCRVEFED
jgi:hypothetical protein